MTIIDVPGTDAEARIRTRLRPLRVATFLQGIAPWVPVEKLFMHQIGFSPAMIAVTAAGYAAVVPIMEIPSGILADRWSRRGVLIIAGLAGAFSVVVGALSQNIAAYVVSALILGVYFAMQSGTVDAIVYDTVLEETGRSDAFERHFGGLHVLSSVALVGSALAGGLIASLASPRAAYLISIPSAVIAVVMLLRFREPRLHRPRETPSLAGHLRATVRDVTRQPGLLPVVTAMALGSMLLQMLFEFGPLWLVSLGASAVVFGPFTAGLTGSLGAGGLLAGRLRLDRTAPAATAVAVMIGCGLVLRFSHSLVAISAAQIVLALLLVATGIHLTRLLHDAVGSSGRTGVASGVSTLSWLAFLPCAMLFALVSHRYGISATGWIVTGLIAVFGLTLLRLSGPVAPGRRRDHSPTRGR
jgi:predicted MFS family arabinose efflux permease